MRIPDSDIEQAYLRLLAWIGRNGWEGIDHYDIMDNAFFRTLVKHKAGIYAATIMLDSAPGFMCSLTRRKPKRNAKALALLAQGYLDYYHLSGELSYLGQAKEAAEWLLVHPSQGYNNLCWGYPFNWQASNLLPAGTPSGVVTANVVDALLALYSETREKRYLDACISACGFFHHHLHIVQMSAEEVSFSYTPYDDEICHNANILVAAAILKTARYAKDINVDFASKAVRFVLNQQNKDGSWHYVYPTGRIDPYHTGFVLRSLHSIDSLHGTDELKHSIRRGAAYFQKHLLDPESVPFYRAGRRYPIDVHSCAETILCFAQLSDLDTRLLGIAEKVARWTIENMQDPTGYFYYRKYPLHRVKIAYFRWAQAWMMRSLAYFLYRSSRIKVANNTTM